MTALTPIERVSLLNDTWALVTAGQQNVADYLKLTTALDQDMDPAVVANYKGPLFEIHDYLLADSDREAFHNWIRATFNPLLAQIKIKTGAIGFDSPDEAVRALHADLIEILGKLGEDPDVIRECRRLVGKYLDDPTSLEPRTAKSVVAVAAHFGDAALFKQFNDHILFYRSVEQYSNLMTALSEFRDPDLTQRRLESCTAPEVHSLTAVYCVASMIDSSATRQAAWAWVKQQWPKVEKKLTMTTGANIVEVTQTFCDAASRDDVQQFFTTHKIFSAERALQQSLEVIDACIRTRSQQQDALTTWLKHQPQSELARWFKQRVGDQKGRVRKIAIVALARKLAIALWRYLETGLVPTGAVLKSAPNA